MICSFARDRAGKFLLLAALTAVAALGVFATPQTAGAGSCVVNDLGNVSSSTSHIGSLDSGDCIAEWRSGSRKWTDYFRFSLTTLGGVTINLSSRDIDPYLVLFTWDGSRSTVLSRNDDGGAGDDARITQQLEAGTYYIAATKFDAPAGSYSVQISLNSLSLYDSNVRREIAEMYKPILYFDSREQYYPVPIEAMLDYSALREDKHHAGFTLSPNPSVGTLAEYARRDNQVDQFLDFDVDRWDSDRPVYTLTAYVHVREINRRVYVQYWYFYVYNLGPPHFAWCEIGNCWYPQRHEGDWESVQVVFPANSKLNEILDGTQAPERVWFAAHDGGISERWNYVFQSTSGTGRRPYVFVALGSHASFPRSGVHDGLLDDVNDHGGIVISYYAIELIDDETDWIAWDGLWGDRGLGIGGFSGPTGPGTKTYWDWEQ